MKINRIKRAFGTASLFVALLCEHDRVQAQGTILVDTHVPGTVDARFTLPNGTGLGAGWIAQIFGYRPGDKEITPLFPITRFRTDTEADKGYVVPVIVTVPNVLPGEKYTVGMWAYPDKEPRNFFDTVGTGPVVITLGGDGQPPAYLTGLQPLNGFIPEPNPAVLATVGAVLLFLGSAFKLRRGT